MTRRSGLIWVGEVSEIFFAMTSAVRRTRWTGRRVVGERGVFFLINATGSTDHDGRRVRGHNAP